MTDARRADELETLLQNLGNDTRVQIYNEGKYAGIMPADSVSLESIFEQYGGGEKTLVIYQGRSKVDSIRVSFDPGIPSTSPAQRKREADAAINRKDGGGISDVLEKMAAAQMSNASTIMTMMSTMATAMAGMITAMKPASDPTDVAVKLATLMKDNNGGGTSPFEAMKFGIDLAGKLGGGSDDDGTMAAVREGLSVVGRAVDAYMEDKRSARTLPAQPADVGAPAPVQQPIPEPMPIRPDDRPWMREVAPHVVTLVTAAGFLTPVAAADAISEKMSDEAFDDLITDIIDDTPPGFAQRLLARFPLLATLGAEYLQALMTAIAESAEEDDAPAPDADIRLTTGPKMAP
jgi:hypothetical protein